MNIQQQKRRLRKTTNEQFELLIREMEKYPAAQSGGPIFGTYKVKWDKMWKRVAHKLNAIGPPHRSLSEWKKVWSDLRGRERKKNGEVRCTRKAFAKSDLDAYFEQTSNDDSAMLAAVQSVEAILNESTATTTTATTNNVYKYEMCNKATTPALPQQQTQTHNQQNGATLNWPQLDSATHYATTRLDSDNITLLLQQQAENQTKLLQLLGNLTTVNTAATERQAAASEKLAKAAARQAIAIERQAIAAERQASATERQASATMALLQFIKERDKALHSLSELPIKLEAMCNSESENDVATE